MLFASVIKSAYLLLVQWCLLLPTSFVVSDVAVGGLQGGRGGTPEVARLSHGGGKPAAAAACRVPSWLEVGDEVEAFL